MVSSYRKVHFNKADKRFLTALVYGSLYSHLWSFNWHEVAAGVLLILIIVLGQTSNNFKDPNSKIYPKFTAVDKRYHPSYLTHLICK